MRLRPALLAAFCALAVAVSSSAVIPPSAPDLPVLRPETSAGHIVVSPAAPVAPSAKTIDGDPTDWIGTPTRLGGSAIYSAGEYVYSDFLGDDHGADDGRDAQRLKTLDPLRTLEPRTYMLDPLAQVLGDEFGLSGPPLVSAKPAYGDAAYPAVLDHHADIAEARVAADASNLYFLVRTTGMIANPGTAVLVLLDTAPGGSYAAPGSITSGAEWALLFAGDTLLQVRFKGIPVALICGIPCVSPFKVATNAGGFTNAVEISIANTLFGALPAVLGVGVATGVVNAAGTDLANVSTGAAKADLINVAFRFDEPVRIHMDREQALALLNGSIDKYLAKIDLGKLASGATELFRPGPGYYDRTYLSSSPVSREESSGGEYQGMYQHYGLYIPTAYVPGKPGPALLWLHPRSSGTTHLAAAWVPGIIEQLGERSNRVVISPSARGSSTWYVGRGHEDFRESWDDAMASWSIDPNRIVVAGHSMGGFGSYLVGLLYPDRFAAAFPISGPPTQGLWLGVAPPSSPQNDGNVDAELLFNIIENARNLPYVIYQGINDELVNVAGVARMAARFTQLGYRNRLYLFPGQDHYVPLVVDEWAAAQRYLDSFRRDPNPAHVTYRVWPALEHEVETVGVPDGVTLDYSFDGAYWVDGLKVRSGSPTAVGTMGTFDAVSAGRGVPNITGVPEAGVVALGQTSPFLMTGLRWLTLGSQARANAFTVNATNIATGTLDVARMALATTAPITGTVTTDGPIVLHLAGSWAAAPTVSGATSSSYAGGVLTITIGSAGTHSIVVTP